MRYLAKSTFFLAFFAAVACDPPDQEMDPEVGMSGDEVVIDTVAGEEVESYRGQVQEALRDTQEELEELRARIAEGTEEGWEELSERAEETWNQLGEALDQARNGGAEDLQRSRENAARHLAELEAKMAAIEVGAASNPEELAEVTSARLERLESDLSELERMIPAQAAANEDIDLEDLDDLRERLAGLRQETQEALQAGAEEFENRRADLGDQFEEVTQEVREHRHKVNWS